MPRPAAGKNIFETENVRKLVQIVEESTRSTKEGVRFFIEPALNTLSRAKSKRHHIIFGRRGSGKSSLLSKVSNDLTFNRIPNAYIDLEKFKSHAYPDVIISVLLESFTEFKKWMDTAAIAPRTKKTFWESLIGLIPERSALDKPKSAALSSKIDIAINELSTVLFHSEESKAQATTRSERSADSTKDGSGSLGYGGASVGGRYHSASRNADVNEIKEEFLTKKIDILHRNIINYRSIFAEIGSLSDGHAFLLMDDLYHIKLSDQANLIDYFHKIAKGANVWLKIGTIRHRSNWYVFGNPPIGMKLGDDADAIDLDVTLEKYDLTKRFLFQILEQFASETEIRLADIITDGARDRLVLASGGVARDFLTIFRRAIDMTSERIARKDLARGTKIGAEDVNRAAGEYDSFKREDFKRDTSGDEQAELLKVFEKVSDFCLNKAKANCFLVDKDMSSADVNYVAELVDLKFMHHVKSRVTVRDRVNRLYDAYMLDISQYAGERARRNFEIVEFWGSSSDDSLRKSKLIFVENPR